MIHPNLPSSYKSLLKTPRSSHVEEMGDGEFWYKGIALNIRERLSADIMPKAGRDVIRIDVNIDGIDLYKKGKKDQMWPILGSFKDFPDEEVFIIAVYCGVKKPVDVAYLRQ